MDGRRGGGHIDCFKINDKYYSEEEKRRSITQLTRTTIYRDVIVAMTMKTLYFLKSLTA